VRPHSSLDGQSPQEYEENFNQRGLPLRVASDGGQVSFSGCPLRRPGPRQDGRRLRPSPASAYGRRPMPSPGTIALTPSQTVAGIARNRLRDGQKWPSNWPANTPKNTLLNGAYFWATSRAESGADSDGRRPPFRGLAPSPTAFRVQQ